MRISARLDESRSQKLELLSDSTQLSTSEIFKRAIDLYYERFRADRPAEILRRSGFVACGEAESTLSERYREELTDLLGAKLDHRR